MSPDAMQANHENLKEDHERLAVRVGKAEERLDLIGRQQAWVFGLGTGLGGAGMLLVQLIIQKVFG